MFIRSFSAQVDFLAKHAWWLLWTAGFYDALSPEYT